MRILRFNMVVIAILVLIFTAHAKSEDSFQFYRVDNIQGFSKQSTTAVAQDSIGFIWIGTRNGLVRFDGYEARYYRHDPNTGDTISNSSVKNLIVDDAGQLWIGTESARIDRFDFATETFQRYELPIDSLDENSILEFSISNGNLFILSKDGNLITFDKSTDSFVKATEDIEISPSEGDRLIRSKSFAGEELVFNLLGIGRILVDIRSSQCRIMSSAESVPVGSNKWSDSFLLVDQIDQYWAFIVGEGLFHLDLKTGSPEHILPEQFEELLGNNSTVTCAIADTDGCIWLGTSNNGLLVYDSISETLSRADIMISDDSSEPARQIECLFLDKSLALWVATPDGLYKYSRYKKKFRKSTSTTILNDQFGNVTVNSLLEDSQDDFWLGTQQTGLLHYQTDSRQYVQITTDNTSTENEFAVTALVEDAEGNVYFGTAYNGLFLVDRENMQARQLTYDFSLMDIYIDHSNIIWLACLSRGICEYNRDTGEVSFWKPTLSRDKNISRFDATVIEGDSHGNIWIGADGGGLIRLATDRKTFHHFVKLAEEYNSISDNRILSLQEDESGTIWIGTRNGLNKLNVQTGEFKHLFTSDGLPDDVICGIELDPLNNLWISTRNGLARLELRTGNLFNYSTADGLVNTEYIPGSSNKTRTGNLYWGGIHSFDTFDPAQLKFNETPPPIAVTAVEKLGVPMQLENFGLSNSRLRIPQGESFLTFTFAALDFNDSDKNRYQYRLAGLHDEWIEAGTDRIANYPHIPEGDYRFEVIGSNNDGIWSDSGPGIQVVVTPLFWQTWEFRLVLMMLIIALIFGVYKIRMTALKNQRNQLVKEVNERRVAEGRLLTNQARLRSMAVKLTFAEEQERRRLASVLHDQIGHSLLSTKVKLANRIQKAEGLEEIQNLRDIIGSLEETIKSTRFLTSEISPPSLYRYGFESAAEGLVERFCTEYEYKSILSIKTKVSPREELSIFLYQSLRELLVNVLKHADGDTIKVKIHGDDNDISVVVADNGKGFDPVSLSLEEDDQKGYGLYSIQERLESFGGKFQITSSAKKGTWIKMEAPLKSW